MKYLFKKNLKNKRILIFGNSGFVGSWLTLSLSFFGAKILGVSLKMKNKNYLSNSSKFKKKIRTLNCDLKNLDNIQSKIVLFKPEIIIHLASQPIVKMGYINAKKTYETNIGGTIKILELARKIKTVKQILIFTSDKVYSNIGLASKNSYSLVVVDSFSTRSIKAKFHIAISRNKFSFIKEYKPKSKFDLF